MNGIEIFILVVLTILMGLGAVHQYLKHKDSLKNFTQDVKDIEVKAEQVVNELYNKDLRPTTSKKPTTKVVEEAKPEFPIDKPKKKRKYYPRKKK